MTTQEQIDRLTGVVSTLASTVVHHDDQIAKNSEQIAGLIEVAKRQQQSIEVHQKELEKLERSIEELRKSMAETDRLWQAYLKRLPPQ